MGVRSTPGKNPMKSDEELRKNFNIFLDDEGILNLTFLAHEDDPENNARAAELVVEAMTQIFEKDPEKRHNLLVDLSLVGDPRFISARARTTYARLGAYKQIENTAVVGKSSFLKFVTNTIARIALRDRDVRWFDTREESLKWLRGQK